MRQIPRKFRAWAIGGDHGLKDRIRRWWLPLIVLVTGLCASFHSWRLLQQYERRLVETRLVAEAEQTGAVIERSCRSALDHLRTIGAFFESSTRVTDDQFRAFTAPILNRPGGPMAVLWIRVAPDSSATAASASTVGRSDPTGSRMGQPDGALGMPARQSAAMTVVYLEPYHRRETFGTDALRASRAMREVLARARASGRCAVSPRMLVRGDTWALLAALPVGHPDPARHGAAAGRQDAMGLVAAVYRMDDMLTLPQGLGHADIHTAVFDRTASEGTQLLHGCGPPQNRLAVHSDCVAGPPTEGVLAARRFAMGDRRWEVVAWQSPQQAAERQGWSPLVASVAVLVATLLIVAYLVCPARQHGVRKRAEQTLRESLAAIAGALRAPAGGVVGMIELLQGTDLDPQQQSFVKVCRDGAESLLGAIDEILDFSNLEAGKIVLEENAFELHGVLEEAADLTAQRAHAKALELICDIEPEARVPVLADRARMRQILVNLIGNAIQRTDTGEVAVHLAILQTDGDALRARFTVTDTGAGIPQQRLAELFEPLAKADGATDRTRAGAGIGLAFSRRLAELMGGRITAESRPGGGAAFRFDVPLRALRGRRSPRAENPGIWRGQRALIVDDNRLARCVLNRQLRAVGIVCEEASSVDEAIASIRHAETIASPFSVVLADFSMPDQNGCDLAALFADRDDLPVIVLCAFDAMLGADQQRRLGIASCLTKPVKQSELVEAVTSALGAAQPQLGELPDDALGDAASGHPDASTCTDGRPEKGTDRASAPIDTRILYERCLGNVEFADSLLKDFAQIGRHRVEQISTSLAESDAESVAENAQSLKGAAAIVAADDVRDIAARLEASGLTGDLRDAHQFVDQLRLEMESCVEYILQPEPPAPANLGTINDTLA